MANSKLLSKAFNTFKDTMWFCTHKDAAKMLIGMGAIGFALSSMAQCFAIKINEKIDSRKKKFLLLQEAADGVVNIGLFLGFTSGIWKISDKILEKLKICKAVKKGNPNRILASDKVRSGGRLLTTTAVSILACNIITPLIRNLFAGKFVGYRDKIEQESRKILLDIKSSDKTSTFNNFDKWAINSVEKLNKKPTNIIIQPNVYKNNSLRI